MAETKQAREELAKNDLQKQKEDLQQKSNELKQKMSSGSGDTSELQRQLDETVSKLARVQTIRGGRRGHSHLCAERLPAARFRCVSR